MKPVVWNTHGYRRPSGGLFRSGYPAEHGFGFEEWNNSEILSKSIGDQRFKVFYTPEIRRDDLNSYAGRIAICMISSHEGSQYLIGLAAGCISLQGEAHQKERKDLVQDLRLNPRDFAAETWTLQKVRSSFGNKEDLLAFWENSIHNLLNWICPTDLYLACPEPLRLNPEELTGKQRLISMYGSYQSIDRVIFMRLLHRLGREYDKTHIEPLAAWADSRQDSAVEDIHQISHDSPTQRTALIQARMGQGVFRSDLMQIWKGVCAVTGCEVPEILRASHIKPWKKSNNAEKLNARNGLLLVAHLDALFDRGLISFDDTGRMLTSDRLQNRGSIWGLGDPLKEKPHGDTCHFLDYHRSQCFF